MRSQVYYNLHKKCYSVRQNGRVVDHADSVVLTDCRFLVQPAGRDKVRRTGVKNVHATVTGIYTPMGSEDISYLMAGDARYVYPEPCDYVSYNPYKYDNFGKITSNGYDGFYADAVSTADYVMLLPNREIRAWGVK